MKERGAGLLRLVCHPAFWLFFAAGLARADVVLHATIGSGMVIQRDLPVLLRGRADPGETIAISQGASGTATEADQTGRWSASLPALPAGAVPDIVIEGKNKIVLNNLLAGDVWLAAGQSNMEFRLRRAAGAEEAISQASNPQIRLFKVERKIAAQPEIDVAGAWQECRPETAAEFSAVAYLFARDLQVALGIPIGIMAASWGGTPGEAWAAPEITKNDPDYADVYAGWERYRADYPQIKKEHDEAMAAWEKAMAEPRQTGDKPPAKPLSKPDPANNHRYPGVLFNGMIHPLVGMPLKGFLWYQGESNKDRYGQYRKLLTSLITDWRRRWGQGDLPFLIVSLSNFKATALEPGDSGRTRLREAQAQVARDTPNCSLAVTIDVGEADDVHPLNKADVGARLSRAALADVYGRPVVGRGPRFRSVRFEDGLSFVQFSDTGGGLVAGRDGRAGVLRGFAVAGKDRRWHWAAARINGESVELLAQEVPDPVAVRYAWADNPPADLYNREGLPAVPFRTDDWSLTEDASANDGPPE